MISSLAKKTRSILAVGSSRASSNGRSGEDKCSNDVALAEDRICSKEPICYKHK